MEDSKKAVQDSSQTEKASEKAQQPSHSNNIQKPKDLQQPSALSTSQVPNFSKIKPGIPTVYPPDQPTIIIGPNSIRAVPNPLS